MARHLSGGGGLVYFISDAYVSAEFLQAEGVWGMDAGAYQCGQAAWQMSVRAYFSAACGDWEQGLSDCGMCYEWDDYTGQQAA